jgi:hypothetical protein
MHPHHCHYSRLSQAASRSIYFSKGLRGFEYLYCGDRVQIPEGIEILPTGVRTAFHARLRTAGNAKQIATEISCSEKHSRPEMAKHETKVKGNEMGACSVIEDAHAGRRIMRRRRGNFGPFHEGLEWGRGERRQTCGLVLDVLEKLKVEVGWRRKTDLGSRS